MVLEKDGEDQLDRSREELKSVTLSRIKDERNILHKIKRRKTICSGQILLRTCLLKHFIEGKAEGSIEMRERRGRRRKLLLDDL